MKGNKGKRDRQMGERKGGREQVEGKGDPSRKK